MTLVIIIILMMMMTEAPCYSRDIYHDSNLKLAMVMKRGGEEGAGDTRNQSKMMMVVLILLKEG